MRVTALVGDREGAPVSIVVTTRRQSLGWGEPWLDASRAWGRGLCSGMEKGPGIGRREPVGVGSSGGGGMQPGSWAYWGRCVFQGWPGIGTDRGGGAEPP